MILVHQMEYYDINCTDYLDSFSGDSSGDYERLPDLHDLARKVAGYFNKILI